MPQAQIDVRYVAKLARLALTNEEVERYGAELARLLDHVSELANLQTQDVEATAQVIALRNVGREDRVTEGLTRETFLAGAPDTQLGMVRVPRIIAEVE